MIRSSSENWRAYANRGMDWLRKENLRSAESDLNAAIRLAPEEMRSHLLVGRGQLYAQLGKRHLALSDFGEAIRLAESAGQPLMPAYFARAELRYKDGDVDLALEDYNVVLQLDPNMTPALIRRGEIYSARGEYELSAKDFKAATEADGPFVGAYPGLGDAYYKAGKYREAIEAFNEAMRRGDKQIGVRYERCWSYLMEGEHQKAIADCDEILKSRPQDPLCHFIRGCSNALIYFATHDEDNYSAALNDLSAAINYSNGDDELKARLLRMRGLVKFFSSDGDGKRDFESGQEAWYHDLLSAQEKGLPAEENERVIIAYAFVKRASENIDIIEPTAALRDLDLALHVLKESRKERELAELILNMREGVVKMEERLRRLVP